MKSWLLLLSTLLFFSCKTTEKTTKVKQPDPLTLTCALTGCNATDEVTLFEFDGIGFKKLQKGKNIGADTFEFKVPMTAPRFYYVGLENAQKRPIILGTEKSIQLDANCKRMRQGKITNSPLNVGYDEVIQQINKYSNESRSLARLFQKNINNPTKVQEAIDKMAQLDQQKKSYLDSMRVNRPYLAKIAALTTYLSYQNNVGSYNSEIEYFGNEFFQFANLKDEDYNHIPYLFESFKGYATTLSGQKMAIEKFYGFVDSTLVKLPENGRAYKYALGGIVLGLQSKNHPGFIRYGKKYIKKYREIDKSSPLIAQLQSKIKHAASFLEGAVAPDFTQLTPEGKSLSLSDLKGKVVLIDFWASWCGPCRRENPHVVKLYNEYKDKGFDVLGVSLDRKREPWLKAIEKDGLQWNHVSDLKGWKNEVAKSYSVSSIPHTVLLDREGRIIGRNFRGLELEHQLAKIFEEKN